MRKPILDVQWGIALVAFVFISGCDSKVSEVDPNAAETVESLEKPQCQGVECAVCQLPWGGTLGADQVFENAFTSELVACEDQCDKHKTKVICKSGELKTEAADGTLVPLKSESVFRSCFKRKCDCSHAGLVIEDGSEQKFFSTSEVACGKSCKAKSIQCREGKLIDKDSPSADPSTFLSFASRSCEVKGCPQCKTPWGESVAEGTKVQAYSTNVATCGQVCGNPVTLTCSNGSMLGGASVYKFNSCKPSPCKDCQLPSGEKVAHGTGAFIHSLSEAPCEQSCVSYRTYAACTDGQLGGLDTTKYKHLNCAPKKACARCVLPCGRSIASGGKDFCFTANKPGSCGETCLGLRQEFTCENGVVKNENGVVVTADDTAKYKFSSCSNSAACSSCTLPDGRAIMDSAKTIFYKKAKVGCSESCFGSDNAVTLTCSNGVFANKSLYKDFNFMKCESDCTNTSVGDQQIGRIEGENGGAPRSLCSLPWKAGMVTHDTEIVAYSRMTAPAGKSCQEFKLRIRCNGFRGLWTGGATYIYPSCIEEK